MPENWIWFWLARRYNVLCFNTCLRIYYQNEGGALCDKPNVEILKRRSMMSYLYAIWHLNDNIDYLLKYENIRMIYKMFVGLWISALLSNKSISDVFYDLRGNIPRAVALAALFPGLLLYSTTRFRLQHK